MKIYVASSWRNEYQELVVQLLQGAGYDVYDFRHPAPGNDGFHWSQVDPNYDNELTKADSYLKALDHPVAIDGYNNDMLAMKLADTFVLVLPCGRSAHLELGWAVGSHKNTCIIDPGDGPVTPELMYKMVDRIFLGSHGFHPLLTWLKEVDV